VGAVGFFSFSLNDPKTRGHRPRLQLERGATTIYFVVSMFIIFGLLAMATDFGRFYLIQAELQTAADAVALAAASRLTGGGTAVEQATAQLQATFDSTTGNDNRFNLRMNQFAESGGSELPTTSQFDFFPSLQDAQAEVNGGLTGGVDWGTGLYPKYVRVRMTAEAPVMFGPILSGNSTRPTIAVDSVAGLSGAICSACGIEGFAVVDPSAGEDADHFEFVPGGFYTLFLVSTQRTAGPVTPAPLAGTAASVPYVVLNHTPSGPADLDVNGTLFEMGASGLSTAAGLSIPGTITIDMPETAYTVEGTTTAGQDLLCGLNVRFGVDPIQNNCANLGGGQFTELASLFSTDVDLGADTYAAGVGLQDFATEYEGNLRRILTLPVVDAADSLTVLNFRQFLIETSPNVAVGLNTTLVTGAFRAQYIGAPIPVRCGRIGGACRVSRGLGRTVLH
jgi:hypothetical protein